MMNQRNTRLLRTAAVLVGLLGVLTMSASAMHIAEGYLPVGWAAGWAWYASPLWWRASSPSRRRSPRPQGQNPVGDVRSVAFVLSALKIPSITGSCSHPTGVGWAPSCSGP